MTMLELSRYIDDQRLWGRYGFAALDWQCRELLGTDHLRGRVLEIGAGEGLMSLWMLHAGATSVTSLEPEAAGATDGVAARAESHRRALEIPREHWDYRPDTLQSYNGGGGYSLILSHSSVNHLDEDACVRLREDPAARARYVELFRKIRDLLEPGGRFILGDAARENYWARLGRKSPWAPEIEWEKHQEPTTWRDVLADAGLQTISWSWFHPFYNTRKLAPLLRNRIAARMLASIFVVRTRRPSAVG